MVKKDKNTPKKLDKRSKAYYESIGKVHPASKKAKTTSKDSIEKEKQAITVVKDGIELKETHFSNGAKVVQDAKTGQFVKGHTPPGRPIGSNYKTLFLNVLGQATADKAIDNVRGKVEEGDLDASLFVLEHIYPKAKPHTYVGLELGKTDTLDDLLGCVSKVIEAVATEKISQEAGEVYITMLERKKDFIFKSRIQVMLDAMKAKDTNVNVLEIMKFYE